MCVAVTVCNGCRNFSDCQHSNTAPFNCQYLSHIFYSLCGDGSVFLALLCSLSVQRLFFALCDIGARFGIFDSFQIHSRYKSFPLPHPTFFSHPPHFFLTFLNSKHESIVLQMALLSQTPRPLLLLDATIS